MAVARNESKWVNYAIFGLLGLLVGALILGGRGGGQQVIVVQQPTTQPAVQPQQPVQPAKPELYDEAKLAVYVRDTENHRLSNVTVELWAVWNLTAVKDKAFYATTGYDLFDRATTDARGRAIFTILADDYVLNVLQEQGTKLYAVAIPNATYYREGVEVTLDVQDGKFTKKYYSTVIKVPYVAQFIDVYNPIVDLRGLKANDKKEGTYNVLGIGENDKGILRVYKVELAPGAQLANVTSFIKEFTVTIGGKTIEIIKDGEVKLDAAKNVTLGLQELKAGDKMKVTVKMVLSNTPDPAYDNAEVLRINIYDVRDQVVGQSSVRIDTA